MSESFTFTTRPDGIIYMRLLDTAQHTVDQWYNTTLELDQQYADKRQPIFTLIDIREMGMPSPYGLARALQAAFKTPANLIQRVAVVTHSNLVTEIGYGIVKRVPPRLHPTIQMFKDEYEALAWLHAEQQRLRSDSEDAVTP